MKPWILLIFLPAVAFATDPLASQFQPSIDTTPSDYATAFGTITMTNSLYKVWQSSVAPGTAHWYQGYSMRNEITSFQVHVSPTVNFSSVTVTISNIIDTQTVPSTIIYATSSDIVVYREWYLNVATPTCASTTTFVGGVRTKMPYALIPSTDPYYHQTTNAFPVGVTSTMTQSAWFDVHIPSAAPSGYYSGSVYVASGSVVISTLPIVIAVWNWVMPSSASLPMIGSGFGYNGFNKVAYNQTVSGCNYPGAGSGSNCDAANINEQIDGATQMLDNKWGIDTPNYIYPGAGSFAIYVSSIGPLLNGTTTNYTKPILPGAALGVIELAEANYNAATWQNWASTFTNQGWITRLFDYPCDEPSGGVWTTCISSMTSQRSWSTPIIPNQVTADMASSITNGATNYIDWMTPLIQSIESPGGGNTRSTYDTWLATSSYFVPRRVGTYMACGVTGTCGQGTIGPANNPAYPNYAVDGTPVANRAFQTYVFVNNLAYELYYAVDECDNTSGGYPCAGSGPDPWYVAYSFGGNGEGSLMLPSTGTITTTSSNIPIWCPSVILKEHRDGMDDYELEKHLTDLGYGSFVNTQIATWYTNDYTFSNDPTNIDGARTAMGNKIHQLSLINGSAQIQGHAILRGRARIL